jgi:hypothetical protein
MKTNKFDEIIQNKLTGIEPTFREEDWQKLQSQMNSPVPITGWQRYGNAVTYAAGVVVALLLIGTNVWQYAENKSLNKKINIAQRSFIATQTQPSTAVLHDTVFITKYKTVYQPTMAGTAVASMSNTRGATVVFFEKQIAALSNEVVRWKNAVVHLEQKLGEQIALNQEISTQQVASHTTASFDPLTPIDYQTSTPDIAELLANKRLRHQPVSTQKPEKEKIVLQRTPRYRVGLGVNAGLTQLGWGFNTEVIVNPRWSMSLGVSFLTIDGDKYFTEEYYNFKTKKDFRGTYAPRLPRNFDILNIDKRAQFVRLPIAVNYRIPLRHRITLLSSAGTDLNLNASDRVTFNYKPDNRVFETVKYENDRTVTVLNNVTLSVGVEKRWGNFIVQAQPYALFSLSPALDESKNPLIGIRIRSLLDLSWQ